MSIREGLGGVTGWRDRGHPGEHRAASEGTLPLSGQRQGPVWSPTALGFGWGWGPRADPECSAPNFSPQGSSSGISQSLGWDSESRTNLPFPQTSWSSRQSPLLLCHFYTWPFMATRAAEGEPVFVVEGTASQVAHAGRAGHPAGDGREGRERSHTGEVELGHEVCAEPATAGTWIASLPEGSRRKEDSCNVLPCMYAAAWQPVQAAPASFPPGLRPPCASAPPLNKAAKPKPAHTQLPSCSQPVSQLDKLHTSAV